MRQILDGGTTSAWALALVVCAGAWLAPAALGSDSVYWSSYTNSGAIRFGDLGGSGACNLFTGESSPDGVAIDVAAAKIYWADTTSGAIRVANLDGTGARDLYTGEPQLSGVAIDPAAGRIYWADAVSGTGTIRVGNLDGTGAAGTLFAGESYPVSAFGAPPEGGAGARGARTPRDLALLRSIIDLMSTSNARARPSGVGRVQSDGIPLL